MVSSTEPSKNDLKWAVVNWFEGKKPPSSVADMEGLKEGNGERDAEGTWR